MILLDVAFGYVLVVSGTFESRLRDLWVYDYHGALMEAYLEHIWDLELCFWPLEALEVFVDAYITVQALTVGHCEDLKRYVAPFYACRATFMLSGYIFKSFSCSEEFQPKISQFYRIIR